MSEIRPALPTRAKIVRFPIRSKAGADWVEVVGGLHSRLKTILRVESPGSRTKRGPSRKTERQYREGGSIVTICAYCHRVRVDEDQWISVERYIYELSTSKDGGHVALNHGICPDCQSEAYPELETVAR